MQPRTTEAAADSHEVESGAIDESRDPFREHTRAFPKAKKPVVARPTGVDREQLARQWEAEAVAGISPFRRAARKHAKERARSAALARADEHNASIDGQIVELEGQAKAAWAELRAHRPDRVVAALDDAFARNGLEATCENAGADAGRRRATIIAIFGPIDIISATESVTNARGDEVDRRRPKADRNALYVDALGSTVLAVAKCAFAAAPALERAEIIVLRHDRGATRVADRLQAIYRGSFDRPETTALPWRTIDPASHILTVDDAELRRRGAADDVAPLDVRRDPALVTILAKFRGLLERSPGA